MEIPAELALGIVGPSAGLSISRLGSQQVWSCLWPLEGQRCLKMHYGLFNNLFKNTNQTRGFMHFVGIVCPGVKFCGIREDAAILTLIKRC